MDKTATAVTNRGRRLRAAWMAGAIGPVLGLAVLGLTLPAAADSLDAALSRPEVRMGETVDLLLRYRPDDLAAGGLSAVPDLGPLEQDFHVLDTRRSQRTTVVNGRRDASLDWVITLTPRHEGAATVPALQVGDARSGSLSLQVAAAPGPADLAADADLPDLFLEAEVDRDDPYVQGQVVLTARIHDAAGMTAAALGDPEVPGAVVERLGEDRTFTERRGGRDYRVIERRFAVFPQSSGTLEIPPLRLEAQLPAAPAGPLGRHGLAGPGAFGPGAFGASAFGPGAFGGSDPFADMFARMRQMGFGSRFGGGFGNGFGDPFGAMFGQRRQVLSQPLALEVRERPAAATADWWLPAEEVKLVEDWSTDSFRVGEPVSRRITLLARGLTGAQLPDLVLPDAPGVKQYVEESGRQTVAGGDSALTARQTLVSVIPNRAGTLQLPEIRVTWWDVAAERERVAVLPSRSLTVAPAAGGQAPAMPAASAGAVAAPAGDAGQPDAVGMTGADPELDLWARLQDHGAGLAAGAGLLLLCAGGLLVRYRRPPAAGTGRGSSPVGPDRSALRAVEAALERACAAGDAVAALEEIGRWGRLRWPDAPPHGATAVAGRLRSAELQAAVQAVTRRVYGDGGADGAGGDLFALQGAFRAARSGLHRRGAGDGAAVGPVPALYPAADGRA